MKTIGTLFSGGGGVEIGAMAAGIQPIWGVEYDAAIAAVYAANIGNHVQVGDILDTNPTDFKRPDVLHASPPCPNFSVAKANGTETPRDIAMAEKVCTFIDVLRPDIFTLENVYLYRKSESWATIRNALYECGYWMDMAHVNAANYGVPQSRKRMIVRALRGRMVPYLPPAVEWVGWYEAIEDLIPGLPDSEFPPWQLALLPAEVKEGLYPSGSFSRQMEPTAKEMPAGVITANSNQTSLRAFITTGGNSGSPRYARQPTRTVTASHDHLAGRAWINGRVVKISSRAMARFQSFPDTYALPNNASLATRIIGNAVPPLLYQRIIEPMIRTLS